uniref:Uncharacterized protein n=1 Tax=Nyssomyia neivai TaxID=330878 RepID=A0A1L8D704_9DIPT
MNKLCQSLNSYTISLSQTMCLLKLYLYFKYNNINIFQKFLNHFHYTENINIFFLFICRSHSTIFIFRAFSLFCILFSFIISPPNLFNSFLFNIINFLRAQLFIFDKIFEKSFNLKEKKLQAFVLYVFVNMGLFFIIYFQIITEKL